jgi:O-antigen/teichoic acid export membrane protein
MVLGTSADNIIQFVIFAILAHLLAIRDLGIVMFTVLFMDVSRVFIAGGLPQAVIQRPDWDDHISSVCFTYNAIMAMIVASLFAFVGAPLMEHYYGSGSGLVMICLSLVFFVDAVKTVHAAKLRREMNYRSLAVRGTFAGLLSGTIAIGMALAGAGVWSLVFQRLTNQSVLTALTWRAARWRPKLVLDRASLREVMPFGVKVTVTRALEMLNQRLPDLIVGFVMGPVGVAIYRVGARALETLRRIVILPFQDASFSALSRLDSKEAIVRAYLRLNRAAATATFPIFLGSTAVAFQVTVALFGRKYAASGEIFAALSIAGIPTMLILFAASAFMAAGQPRIGTITNGALAVLNLVLVTILALRFGTLGAAVGNLIALILILPVVVLLLKHKLGMRVRDFLRALAPPFFISAAMAAGLWAVKLWVMTPHSNIVQIAILVPLGAALYAAIFAVAARGHLRELLADLMPILPATIRSKIRARQLSEATPR